MTLNDKTLNMDAALIRHVQVATSSARAGKTTKSTKAVDMAGIETIVRQVKRNYADRIKENIDREPKDRIIEAIEWLTTEYPGTTVPMNLLYWMVNGGNKLLRQDSEDIIRFSHKVGRYKKYMLQTHTRSFVIRAGMIRGYVSREEHAREELPKAINRATSAINNAALVSSAVGNPESLKVPLEEKSGIADLLKSVKSMQQALPLLTQGSKTPKK